MPFVKDIFSSKKIFVARIVLLALLLLLPAQQSFFFFYRHLSVDAILGIFFGFSLIFYFNHRDDDNPLYGILMLSATVFMLPLTKDIGLLLAIGVISVILLDSLLFRRDKFLSWIKNSKCSSHYTDLMMIVIPSILVLFVRVSWSNLLSRSVNVKYTTVVKKK